MTGAEDPPQPTPHPPLATLLRRGVAAHQAGQPDQAAACFEQALVQDPAHPDALFLLGAVRITQQRNDAAEALIQRALRLRPDFPQALQGLADLWRGQGRIAEAHVLLRRALSLQPGNLAIRADLGSALYEAGRPEEAIPHFRAALARTPADGPLLVSLGRALRATGDFPAAEAAYRDALAITNEPEVHNNLGNVLLARGNPEAAITAYRHAIAQRPDYGDAHYNLGMALLAAGRLADGWRECAWRLRTPKMRAAFGSLDDLWSGEPMPNQTLLLRAEQGQGDTIQFCRYAPLAANRSAARIILEVERSLTGLLAGLADEVIAQGDPLPPFDRQCPLMSLPDVFGTTLDTVPAAVPYLVPDATKVAAWQTRLNLLPGLKVGLVWAGDPGLGNTAMLDRRRSMRLAQLAPLAAVPDAVFVSLQKGAASAETRTPPAGMALLDWTGELHDFADTAALIGALDLVIGVDTAVIHLAGALGRPVWLLNRLDSEWRWLLQGDTSPWYPTLRIVRQTVLGIWDGPMQAVAEALAAFPIPERGAPPAEPLDPAIGVLLRDGLADQQAGRTEAALQRYQDVLRLDPDQPDALYLSGMYHLAGGHMEQGIALVQRALRHRPAFPAAQFNLGMAYHALDREADAIEPFQRAIELDPGMAEAHAALGGSLHRLARMEEARDSFRRSLELRPDDAATLLNYGVVLQALLQFEDAITCYRRAIALQPVNVDAHNNLGTALAALHQMDAAIESYRRALALDAGHAQTHANLGIALLQAGRYAEGWPEWEWRVHTTQGRQEDRGFAQPAWDGSPIPGQTLLLHAEQGLGDTLQFFRYVPLAVERSGATVVLEVQPELFRLLEGQGIVARVVPRGRPLPAFDRHCSLASLPSVFGTTLETVPDDVPYLRVSRSTALAWRARLDGVADFVAEGDLPVDAAASVMPGRMAARSVVTPSTAAYPVTAESSTAHPVMGERVAAPPVMADSIAAHPVMGERVAAHPVMAESIAAHPIMGERVAAYSVMAESITAHPVTGERVAAYSVMAESIAAHPVTGERVAAYSVMAESIAAHPVMGERVAAYSVMAGEGPPSTTGDAGSGKVMDGGPSPAMTMSGQCLAPVSTAPISTAPIPTAVVRAAPVPAATNPPRPPLRVGIVWAGNAGLGSKTHNPVDQQRSLPLSALAPLARIPGVALISLQKGPAAAQAHPPPDGIRVHDWTGELTDFADTAALVACLHLVITVDTSVAHLAGALGRPVWLLNRHHPDWRWLLGREDSPWYPTLRQFRQTTRGDWAPVIAAVTGSLARMAAGPPEDEPFDHGNERFRQGDYPAAAAAFRQAIALQPNHAGARGNLSVALLTQLRPDAAEKQARQALQAAPESQPLRLRLGIALHALGRVPEAIVCLREACDRRPDDADAHSALGNALAAAGALEDGIAAHRRAVALRPANDLLRANLGYVLLQAGHWAEGWREHEYRADRPALAPPAQRWRGEALGRGVLLLRSEQGFGDVIQFCRFAPIAAARAGVPTLLTAPRALRTLLGSLPGITIVPPGTPLPDGREIPLLSLPLLFGTGEATIPAQVPYLQADPQHVAAWRDRLAAWPGLRVGVAWAGNPGLGRGSLYATDRRRSLPDGALQPLAVVPGISFVSLQVGPAPSPGLPMQDWTSELTNFAMTAALIQALDLVIAVDTAVAHLAGALGRPVWLLNRFDADWRWLRDRDDSPWYPTLRQFRQAEPGDWAGVMTRVAAALRDPAGLGA
jgi:tetratricopeptide (TPR) repeat protein